MATRPETFTAAVEHLQSGRLAEAERLCRQILAAEPNHPQALHLYGLLALQAGQPDVAVDMLTRAIALLPEMVAAHGNLGIAYFQQGKFQEATASFRQAVRMKPDYAEAHNNLGNVLRETGDLEPAAECYERALEIQPNYADAHNNLGVVSRQLGKLAEATACYRRALQLNPHYADAHNNLGNVLRDQGELDQAWLCYQNALRLNPNDPQAYNGMAIVLMQRRNVQEAVDHFRRALEIQPNYRDALNNLGAALREQRHYSQAAQCYQKSLEIKPDQVETLSCLALVEREQGNVDRAIEHVGRALEIDPEYAEAHFHLGLIHQELGQLDQARDCFLRALERKPQFVPSHFELAQSKKFQRGDVQIEQMEQLLVDESTSEVDRMALHFALGEAYDDLGDFDRAFEHFREGNQQRRRNVQYDPADRARFVDDVIDYFSAERLAELGDSLAIDSDIPIFIVGMPRSGTTLVEQIVSSHPQVHGGGELLWLSDLQPRLKTLAGADADFPHCLDSLSADTARQLAAEYVDTLRQKASGQPHVTDKMPANFFMLGLIALLWPRSRVIHCRRDPMAVGLSCFRRLFKGEQPFAWDLVEIGHYWRQYDRLVRHWQSALPISVYELHYEQLVQHPESQIRRLIDYCRLDWDPRCLEHHATARRVTTDTGVRSPIHQSAAEHWRNYADHLEPLKRALAGEIEPGGDARPPGKSE